jgi:branched-chain amino acid transport system ATP-binding protein
VSSLLEIRGLEKRFGGVCALQSFDLDINQSETVGLIGPNGAGKSTLLNLIAGALKPSAGTIRFSGTDISRWPAHNVCRLGIVKTSQITRPFAHLSVRENVMTAAFLRHSEPKKARHYADKWITHIGLEAVAQRTAGSLSTSQRKRLEVARALATEPQFLLLDEVFAGLTAFEVQEALLWASQLPALGVTILITEHVLAPITALARRTIVLDQGLKICDDLTERTLRDPRVLRAYLGDENELPA